MRSSPVFAAVVLTLFGCGGSGGSTGGDGGTGDGASTTVNFGNTHHEFPSIHAASGANITGQCQSWTLHNDETLYMNSLDMAADPGWHHSNWVYVPDTMYGDPGGGDGDGTWRCADRSFSELSAATVGSVFFAQSTQSTHETQAFQPGIVLAIPPHSRIIGSIHLVNATPSDFDTKLSFDMHLIPQSQVTVRLSPMSMTFEDGLLVPANQTSDSTLDCNVQAALVGMTRHPIDFKIYYVLPHYHSLGTGMTVTAVGGPVDGMTIFDNTARIGDPLGQTLTTPFDLSGATGIKFTCHYDNATSADAHFSNSLAGEMCVFLAYTDSPYTIGALSMNGGHPATSTPEPDGTPEYTAPCGVIAVPTPSL